MAKNLERRMVCKNCNQVEIGKDPEDGKWYEVNNDTQLHFYKCPEAPHKDKKFTPRAKIKGIEMDGIISEIKDLKSRLDKVEEAIKALVATASGNTTLG